MCKKSIFRTEKKIVIFSQIYASVDWNDDLGHLKVRLIEMWMHLFFNKGITSMICQSWDSTSSAVVKQMNRWNTHGNMLLLIVFSLAYFLYILGIETEDTWYYFQFKVIRCWQSGGPDHIHGTLTNTKSIKCDANISV